MPSIVCLSTIVQTSCYVIALMMLILMSSVPVTSQIIFLIQGFRNFLSAMFPLFRKASGTQTRLRVIGNYLLVQVRYCSSGFCNGKKRLMELLKGTRLRIDHQKYKQSVIVRYNLESTRSNLITRVRYCLAFKNSMFQQFLYMVTMLVAKMRSARNLGNFKAGLNTMLFYAKW